MGENEKTIKTERKKKKMARGKEESEKDGEVKDGR